MKGKGAKNSIPLHTFATLNTLLQKITKFRYRNLMNYLNHNERFSQMYSNLESSSKTEVSIYNFSLHLAEKEINRSSSFFQRHPHRIRTSF